MTLRLSENDYAALLKKQGKVIPPIPLAVNRNKYGNKRVMLDGIEFDSKAEAARYSELLLQAKVGLIYSLRVHPKYHLTVNDVEIGTYEPDFDYVESNSNGLVVEDVKSPVTAQERSFRRVCKLMKAIHDIDVQVVMMKGRKKYGTAARPA
jgi:Protein of unknown function (DUF1064)